VRPFTDAVRAGDLEAAKAAYAPSRVPWERIEPIAGLVEDIDTAVDARVDDFEGPDDAEFTGWHRLEYLLFDQGTTEGAASFADRSTRTWAGWPTSCRTSTSRPAPSRSARASSSRR
jgi:iron uptake system component EfeO